MVPVKDCEVNKIKEDSLPTGVSIRDICDCGRHKHYPITPVFTTKKTPIETDTNYNTAYKHIKDIRPRSSKRPLPDVHGLGHVPMTFDTNQRDDFKNLGPVDRVKLCIHSDNYEASTEPFLSKTSYRSEFTPKQILPEIRRVDPLAESRPSVKGDKFSSETTSKEHYKQWVAQPAMSFRDLPTFTGSVLFPEKGLQPTSTFQASFLGKYHPPAEMSKTGKVINLKNEGSMLMNTTSQSAYIRYDGDHRAQRVDQKTSLVPYSRSRFNGETQNMKDFGSGTSKLPLQQPSQPPPTTIKIRYDDSTSFSTEQRSIYKGHDTVKHPVVKSFKREVKEYEIPEEKIQSITSQKNDYQPIDVSQVNRVKISRYDHDKLKVGGDNRPFEGTTTNKLFYKDWGTGERIRFGDYHDRHPYMPPSQPMAGDTTTHTTFTPKKADRAPQFIPEQNLGRGEGAYSFNTEYKQAYKEQELHVCPAQRYIVQKEMKKRRATAQEIDGCNPGNAVAVI